jgi:hypothetical protein
MSNYRINQWLAYKNSEEGSVVRKVLWRTNGYWEAFLESASCREEGGSVLWVRIIGMTGAGNTPGEAEEDLSKTILKEIERLKKSALFFDKVPNND